MSERSLALIKPDAVEKNLIGEVIGRYEKNGLKVTALKMLKVSEEFAGIHYSHLQGKVFYQELIDFITRSPLCAVVLQGENVVEKVREINGATDPKEAAPGTIRNQYGTDKTENCVHASDSAERAKIEIALWFPELL